MGGCQNYGPFLGTLNIRCRIIIGTQKGTIISTTTQMMIEIMRIAVIVVRIRIISTKIGIKNKNAKNIAIRRIIAIRTIMTSIVIQINRSQAPLTEVEQALLPLSHLVGHSTKSPPHPKP